jgi:hypothetical protein
MMDYKLVSPIPRALRGVELNIAERFDLSSIQEAQTQLLLAPILK